MSLMHNVCEAFESEDRDKVEAIARTLMSEFYHRKLDAEDSGASLIAFARKGEPRAMHCVSVAGVLVNYLREELEGEV